MMSSIQFGAS